MSPTTLTKVTLADVMATVLPESAPTSKTDVGARVHAKSHFAMGEHEARRCYGADWNTCLVSGTVLEVYVDRSGKRANVFLDVIWEFVGGNKERRVNVRSVTFGDAPGATPTPIATNPHPPPGAGAATSGAAGPLADDDAEHRQAYDIAYSNDDQENEPTGGNPGPPLSSRTAFVAHGVPWVEKEVLHCVGNPIPRRCWDLRLPGGESIVEGGEAGSLSRPRRCIDYLMAVWPMQHISQVTTDTSKALVGAGKPSLSPGELMKWVGVLILGTSRVEPGTPSETGPTFGL